MDADLRQAAVSVLLVALLVASVVLGGNFVSLTAPASGEVWATADDANAGSVASVAARTTTGPRTVESPYGRATVRYDAHGVPHVTAESQRAAAFAVGYVQARDRLFQMDLQRRLMAGNLSAAFGERAVESDRFHRKMDFEGAAAASWRAVRDTESGRAIEAYTAGVNRYMDTRPLPMEFRLNDYEPTRWQPEDTLLIGKLIAWRLTGDFEDLRREVAFSRLENASTIYPRRLDHDSTVVGRANGATWEGGSVGDFANASGQQRVTSSGGASGDFRALYETLEPHAPDARLASNNWVVSGEYTESGKPILANDPHLSLTVPPVWYEMHVRTDEANVRGVSLPGTPAVVIGENDAVAWGFTNVGSDVTDLYTYERPSADTYRYRGETREIRTRTETIPVAGGEDVRVTVRKTVHGPLLERETPAGTEEVAVAWTGLTATREVQAVYDLNTAGNLDDVRAALRKFDSPTQNIVAMDEEGGTLWRATGKYPVRRVDGRVVRGDRVFDGSAGHGEWQGYTPYGNSTWEGFVPFEEVPHLDDPGYVATANQRLTDDPGFYLSTSTRFADPYRGKRIYDRLDAMTAEGPVSRADVQDLQRDVRSEAAAQFVPLIADAAEQGALDGETADAAAVVAAWDREMTRDSEGALYYALFRDRFRNATFHDEFHPEGLDESYYPHYWTLGRLPADSPWFDDERTPERETRADVVARAMRGAVREAEREGYDTYGDYNELDLTHPFPLDFLDYPQRPMDGSPFTVSNFRSERATQHGSSWRMVSTGAADQGSVGVVPGGQSGNYFSPHYRDQLGPWAAGEYKSLNGEVRGKTVIRFREGSS